MVVSQKITEGNGGKMKPRFFYLIPKVGWKRFDGETSYRYFRRILTGNNQPSGGVQVIYQHCDILNQNGFEAFPVNLGNGWNSFKANWFTHLSKPITAQQALKKIQKTDIILCPEVIPDEIGNFPLGHKVLFVQNWGLVNGEVSSSHFEKVLTVSPYCKDWMKECSSLPVSLVTNGINLDLFKEIPKQRKANRVLFWGRKNRIDGLRAIEMLPSEIRLLAEFVEASNGLTQATIARLYQESDIFIALGYPEGFALPPLEAMACGCAVVGFTGGGGNVHMVDGETALVAEDGNVKQLANVLERVLIDHEFREKIRTASLKKSKEFTFQWMEKELLSFAKGFREGIK